MPRPPEATPHSDIDGVHQDERRNTDVAAERGEGAEDLKKAKERSAARPHAEEGEGKDDRTR